MNMTPEDNKRTYEPTDEQLDAMLRDVQIPADLKSRLNRIPEPTTATEECNLLAQATPLPKTTVPTRVTPAQTAPAQSPWLSYALAASLLAVATLAVALSLTRKNQDVVPELATTKTFQGAETNLEPVPEDLVVDSSNESDKQDQELQILQAEVQELEIARLESELFQLKQLNSTRLSQLEIESIIMALAPEHSISLGGDEAYVRSEMARVQREYPDTRGAMLADKILQAIN